MKFPKDVSAIILDYARIWTIAPWVPSADELRISREWPGCSLNAIRSFGFCENPMACDVITENHLRNSLLGNSADWAVDMSEKYLGGFDIRSMHIIARNTNPRAMEFIRSRPEIYTEEFPMLLTNPAAIDLIRDILVKNPGLYSHQHKLLLLYNPKSEPRDHSDCSDEEKIMYYCRNPAPWAIEYLQEKNKTSSLDNFINTLCLNPHPWALSKVVEYISKNTEDDHLDIWDRLSYNPAAIDILKAHPEMITTTIWENPGIFEPTVRPGIADILDNLTW